MIFATDLDGTIIFSERYLKNSLSRICIEKKGDQNISYITENSIELINKLKEECLFIPTTTRTIEQFKRINLFQDAHKTEYAITSNGGTILRNGNVDLTWKKMIEYKIQNLPFSMEKVKEQFVLLTGEEWIIKGTYSENMFWTFIVDKSMLNNERIEEFEEWANKNELKTSFQNRKFYVIPSFISKWKAIQQIQKELNEDVIISAGDTNLDREMLESANLGFVPFHSDLMNMANERIKTTKNTGLLAGEEILENVYRIAVN